MPSRALVIDEAEKRGKKDGRQELGQQVLEYLELKYLADNVERGTPHSKEILDLTRELAKLIRGEIKGG